MPNSAGQPPSTPEEHFRQIAAIFACGVRRYHERLHRYEVPPSEQPEKEVASGLEVLDATRLSVSRVSC